MSEVIFSSKLNKRDIFIDKFNEKRKKRIVDEIVEKIIKERKGQLYYEEILQSYINDYFEQEIYQIKSMVDKIIVNEYLEDDNMTVKEVKLWKDF